MKRFLTAFAGTLAGGLLVWMFVFTRDLFFPPDPCVAPPPVVVPADDES